MDIEKDIEKDKDTDREREREREIKRESTRGVYARREDLTILRPRHYDCPYALTGWTRAAGDINLPTDGKMRSRLPRINK
jgi:hypothetical protein